MLNLWDNDRILLFRQTAKEVSLCTESFLWQWQWTDHNPGYILFSHDYLFDSQVVLPLVKVRFKCVITSESLFPSSVCLCVYEGDCLVCFVFARPHSGFLYVLIVYWWLKTSIIHGHPAMQQGDSDSISHLRSEGFNPLSMNNHSSLKSICFEYVTQIKLYRKDAVTW